MTGIRASRAWHVLAAVLSCAAVHAAPDVNDLSNALLERQVPLDSNLVRRAALEGVLKAVDPGARLLSAADAEALFDGKTVQLSEDLGEGLCYLKLSGVRKGGGEDVARVLETWSKQGLFGVILDLRGAGGQSLDAVDAVAAALGADESARYAIKNGHGDTVEARQPRGEARPWAGKPVMVLVDKETTDAGEVLASLVKGRPGVMLLGTATRGDSGIREVVKLSDDTMAYVRTKWISVDGRPDYNSVGVLPDVVVEKSYLSRTNAAVAAGATGHEPSQKALMDRKLMERVESDAVLARAADILLGLKALDAYGSGTITNSANHAGP